MRREEGAGALIDIVTDSSAMTQEVQVIRRLKLLLVQELAVRANQLLFAGLPTRWADTSTGWCLCRIGEISLRSYRTGFLPVTPTINCPSPRVPRRRKSIARVSFLR